jgi:hypothetical protein
VSMRTAQELIGHAGGPPICPTGKNSSPQRVSIVPLHKQMQFVTQPDSSVAKPATSRPMKCAATTCSIVAFVAGMMP